jgi:hypothetical protein
MGAGSHFVRSLGAGAIEMDLLSQVAVIVDDFFKLLLNRYGRLLLRLLRLVNSQFQCRCGAVVASVEFWRAN